MSGYWAMGSTKAETPPTRRMTMEMTQDKMGRSMKNLATPARPPSPGTSPSHGHLGRLDGDAWLDALQPADDDPLARLDAAFDDAHAVADGPECDAAVLDHAFVVDDVEELAVLVADQG